jgi:hypothetical protein
VLDELRQRIATFLSQNKVCVISTSGCFGAWAVSAQYQNHGLELDCQLPRWSDTVYHLEQDPQTLVIVLDEKSGHSRWLQYRGIATVNVLSADERYVALHITPERIDLIDESRGWGARETLDF